MPLKRTGYDFWENVLNNPKYVAAPMVDMSELSFRMICRKYGTNLCFSPMFHSQQFVQDSLYRSDLFSTCDEDTPLIVQFCANDPLTFVNAASLVSHQCSAIDLNLGCPQAIARKGYYGAFLQDDWELIHSIVRKAALELTIPVTCKMRILPGSFTKSIEYAKMLEESGCSILTIHGRTRDQKGHATGLASWDVIKEIKAHVKIPVIANGNILSFDDVNDCLEYTKADAVMSAEALLHNPALFSGEYPPVWKIVNEYLQLSEKYKTPLRYVRCHLFKILYLCIHQDEEIKDLLTNASNFDDFYIIGEKLKTLPSKINFAQINEKAEDLENKFESLNIDVLHSQISDKCKINSANTLDLNFSKNETIYTGINEEQQETYDHISFKLLFNSEIEESVKDTQNDFETKELLLLRQSMKRKHLPIWLCHSRPRISVDDKTRGSYSKYFHLTSSKSNVADNEEWLSKKKLKQARHHARVLTMMKEKRKMKKMRRKLKIMEKKSSQINEITEKSGMKITKKQRKEMIRQRLLNAKGYSPKVCINLGFSQVMETQDLHRLSSQLRRLYGSNRHSEKPLHLYFCNFNPSDELYKICERKNDGFASYEVEMTEKCPEEIFCLDDIIYLSPDSENVLEKLDKNKIYVIGGIVDRTVKKGLSLGHAQNLSIQTARLPITEYLVKCSQSPGTTVLTVNQVFDILLKFYETEDWIEALSINVPRRKGFCAPSKTVEQTKLHIKSVKDSSNELLFTSETSELTNA